MRFGRGVEAIELKVGMSSMRGVKREKKCCGCGRYEGGREWRGVKKKAEGEVCISMLVRNRRARTDRADGRNSSSWARPPREIRQRGRTSRGVIGARGRLTARHKRQGPNCTKWDDAAQYNTECW